VIRVRQAEPADAAPIARVLVHTFLAAHRGQIPEEVWLWREREWTPVFVAGVWERTLREIAAGTRPGECAFVAEAASGEIIGVAKAEPAGESEAEVTALYVHPDHQGRGAGRLLLAAVAAHQAARGVTRLRVGTLVTNTPARRFYEACGGQVVAERAIEDGGHPLREIVYEWFGPDALRALCSPS
jgi:ribosomal protein S18 acetylase RimI-like enzyme